MLKHNVVLTILPFYRLKRSELSAEKNNLVQNGPVATSTPFVRQSSLQQEILDQEVRVLFIMPYPMSDEECLEQSDLCMIQYITNSYIVTC